MLIVWWISFKFQRYLPTPSHYRWKNISRSRNTLKLKSSLLRIRLLTAKLCNGFNRRILPRYLLIILLAMKIGSCIPIWKELQYVDFKMWDLILPGRKVVDPWHRGQKGILLESSLRRYIFVRRLYVWSEDLLCRCFSFPPTIDVSWYMTI